MEKYIVKCYFEYNAVFEVEANSPKEAKKIGYNKAMLFPTDKLEFVDYTNTEVLDENHNILLVER